MLLRRVAERWLPAAIARRRSPAKLMLLGTFRTIDIILSKSPLNALKQDLLIHGLCREIALRGLAEAEVVRYLEERFPGLGKQVEESMAIAIDGEIFQDAYSAKFGAENEVVLIPKIGGG